MIARSDDDIQMPICRLAQGIELLSVSKHNHSGDGGSVAAIQNVSLSIPAAQMCGNPFLDFGRR